MMDSLGARRSEYKITDKILQYRKLLCRWCLRKH